MRFFARQGRALLLAVVMAVCIWGCGGDGNPVDNSGNNSGYSGPSVNYGGKTYKTVVIENQTWMAENLNFQTSSGSWCYENSADSCAKYGRLYTWSAAKTTCPNGWHLPSNLEWGILVDYAGGENVAGKKLKSTSGWNWNDDDNVSGNGTDDFGFSALPGGFRRSGGSFGYAGQYGGWWTATEYDSDDADYRGIRYNGDDVDEDTYGKSFGLSVRCVKD
jgi:uncharacterized protein (TIGR02145 family)